MKLKSLSFGLLSLSLGLIYITMSSDSNGRFNSGTTCGNCHGSANSVTTVALTGLPTTFTTNQTYTLSFTVTNQSLSHAGFNIKCSAGTFTAGSGSQVNTAMNQITHTAPMASTSSSAPFTETFTFSWKAPATTAAVTFSCVGNAVNFDGNDGSLDQWNSTSYSVNGSFPSGVSELHSSSMAVYPNPAVASICLRGMAGATQVKVFNLFGQSVNSTSTVNGNDVNVDISQLPMGQYIVSADIHGTLVQSRFEKQ